MRIPKVATTKVIVRAAAGVTAIAAIALFASSGSAFAHGSGSASNVALEWRGDHDASTTTMFPTTAAPTTVPPTTAAPVNKGVESTQSKSSGKNRKSVVATGSGGANSSSGDKSTTKSTSDTVVAYDKHTGSTDAQSGTKACTGSSAATDIQYWVNGKKVPALAGNTKPGVKVKVSFKVAQGCGTTKFGLAGYDADSPDDSTLSTQRVHPPVETVTGASGDNLLLEITAPNCYYQVDFFTGNVITTFDPADGVTYSDQHRLIAYDNGGSNMADGCVKVEDTSSTVVPTTSAEVAPAEGSNKATTTTTAASGSVEVGPSETARVTTTTAPSSANVGAVNIAAANTTTTTSGSANVQAAAANATTTTTNATVEATTLARTGSPIAGLGLLGGGLAIAGGAMQYAAARLRRRRS